MEAWISTPNGKAMAWIHDRRAPCNDMIWKSLDMYACNDTIWKSWLYNVGAKKYGYLLHGWCIFVKFHCFKFLDGICGNHIP